MTDGDARLVLDTAVHQMLRGLPHLGKTTQSIITHPSRHLLQRSVTIPRAKGPHGNEIHNVSSWQSQHQKLKKGRASNIEK